MVSRNNNKTCIFFSVYRYTIKCNNNENHTVYNGKIGKLHAPLFITMLINKRRTGTGRLGHKYIYFQPFEYLLSETRIVLFPSTVKSLRFFRWVM